MGLQDEDVLAVVCVRVCLLVLEFLHSAPHAAEKLFSNSLAVGVFADNPRHAEETTGRQGSQVEHAVLAYMLLLGRLPACRAGLRAPAGRALVVSTSPGPFAKQEATKHTLHTDCCTAASPGGRTLRANAAISWRASWPARRRRRRTCTRAPVVQLQHSQYLWRRWRRGRCEFATQAAKRRSQVRSRRRQVAREHSVIVSEHRH